MNITRNWLTGLLQKMGPGQEKWTITDEELDAAFVRVGFETEGYSLIEPTSGDLVLGRVEHIEELTGFKKPIRYCQVNVGQANGTGELQGIICGARNFAEGDLVVVALPGAVLPGGFAIAARKTYDHISNGMLCSAAELGMARTQTSGIITLPDNYGEPGDDARPVLGLDDTIFDVNVTPDRGYALSARGLAREIASACGLDYRDPALHPEVCGLHLVPPPTEADLLAVTIAEETETRRFGLRKVTGIDPTAESPFWLQRELLLSGIRPVNGATDVTNYLMLLLGTPMHAFDAAKITGPLTVQLATDGEVFETLDHVNHTLSSDDVVISDAMGIQSLAGVMGGTTSEISGTTTEVYFEAAVWDPRRVARTSRRHKLSSEASRRFERGVDSALVEVALDLACALLIDIAGGEVADGRFLYGSAEEMPTIPLRLSHPSELIGVNYSSDTVIRRLTEIGAVVERGEDDEVVTVVPPTWRTDMSMPEDLIEEIVRLEGLEQVPSVLPRPVGGRGLTRAQRRRRAVGHALAYQGYTEIIPTPFMSQTVLDQWGLPTDDARRQVVRVRNPLDADYAVLATTLLPAMLEAVSRNLSRGQRDISIFGLQQVSFRRADLSPMPAVDGRPDDATISELIDSLPLQPIHAVTVGLGEIDHSGPWGDGRIYSYEDAIESARIITRAAGVRLSVRAAAELPWHPGRCAALVVGDTVVGYAGELHPQILEDAGLPERVCAMELDLTGLPMDEDFPAPVLSAFPPLHQDIALVVDESVPVEELRRVVVEGAGELAETVEIFDIFRSKDLGEDKKSVAMKVMFRAPDRTLTDDEASECRLRAVRLAEERLDATMRA